FLPTARSWLNKRSSGVSRWIRGWALSDTLTPDTNSRSAPLEPKVSACRCSAEHDEGRSSTGSASMLADLVIRNVREIATPSGRSNAPLAGAQMREVDVIPDGVVAIRDGMIVAIGRSNELAGAVDLAPEGRVIDADGRVVIPGLVDPHTHLLF